MGASWECLRKVGNLSSASVLLVLEEVFKRRRPEAGTYSVLAAMGPGFCSELGSSQVELMGSDVLKTDVFIVGGGPAGLATAIAIRQRGLSVVVADLARPPIDKACGEGLMPQTVAALKDLGVTLGPSQAIPFRGIRFIGEGTGRRRATFPKVMDWGFAAPPCTKRWWRGRRKWACNPSGERAVKGIDAGEVSLDSGKVQCRWIIGADGQNSLVRKWAGLDRGRPQETRFGFRQHFRVAPWTDFVEVHWGRRLPDCCHSREPR